MTKAFPLAIRSEPDRVFNEHARDEWTKASEVGEGVLYNLRPLGSPSPSSSLPALEAAKCAHKQGRQHGEAFENQVMRAYFSEGCDISKQDILQQIAGKVGLDVGQFQRDWKGGAPREQIKADVQEAQKAGIACVPTVLISGSAQDGTAVIKGDVPYDQYRRLVIWYLST